MTDDDSQDVNVAQCDGVSGEVYGVWGGMVG